MHSNRFSHPAASGRHGRRRGESGQAMMELCAILVCLVAVVLGIIFMAGLGIANNHTLLEAKANAETRARSGLGEALAGDEITGWTYGRVDFGGDDTAIIPFTALDRMGRNDAVSAGLAAPALLERRYSDANLYNYTWKSPFEFDDSLRSDFSSNPGNAFHAADLVRGSAYGEQPVSGFEAGYRRNVTREMRDAFRHWFGVTVDDDFLAGNVTNQVFLPRAAPQPEF